MTREVECVVVYTDRHHIPFLIDAEDYEAVRRYSWSIDGSGYPATRIGTWRDGRKCRLHEFLLGFSPEGMERDHRNRFKADNRRSNLRLVTAQVNRQNTGPRRSSRSGVKGVWQGPSGTWLVQIMTGGVHTHVGSFPTLEEASAARRAAEQELWAS